MALFVENSKGLVDIAPEARTIKQFKKIITRDKDRFKKRALSELAFIYFFADIQSNFNKNYPDDDERIKNIVESLDDIDNSWKVDAIIQDAIDFYIENNTTASSRALTLQRKSVDSLVTKINKFASSDDINDISKAAKMTLDIPLMMESISKLEKMVKGESATGSKHRGNQEKNLYEDGL